jgi:hypothetical protein
MGTAMPWSSQLSDGAGNYSFGLDASALFQDALNNQNMPLPSAGSGRSSTDSVPDLIEANAGPSGQAPPPPPPPLPPTVHQGTSAPPVLARQDSGKVWTTHDPKDHTLRRITDADLGVLGRSDVPQEVKAGTREAGEELLEITTQLSTVEQSVTAIEQETESLTSAMLMGVFEKIEETAARFATSHQVKQGHKNGLNEVIDRFEIVRGRAEQDKLEGIEEVPRLDSAEKMIAAIQRKNRQTSNEAQNPPPAPTSTAGRLWAWIKPKPGVMKELRKLGREADTTGKRLGDLINESPKDEQITAYLTRGRISRNKKVILLGLAATAVTLPAIIVPMKESEDKNKRLSKANGALRTGLGNQSSRADTAEETIKQLQEEQAINKRIIEDKTRQETEKTVHIEALMQRLDEVTASPEPAVSSLQSLLIPSLQGKFKRGSSSFASM